MKQSNSVVGFLTDMKRVCPNYVFDKSGLGSINKSPNSFYLNSDGSMLMKVEKHLKFISPRSGIKLGETILFASGTNFTISAMKLIRLDDITEEIAISAGVEKIGDNMWKHYSPELFYPKAVLKKQDPGHPYFTTAKASFVSLWCKRYGMMDIYENPWIWQYTCVKEVQAAQYTAKITVDNNTEFTLSYTTLEELSSAIFDRLIDLQVDHTVIIEFDSKFIIWDFSLAHYCFAKGVLSVDDFVKIVFLRIDPTTGDKIKEDA